VNRKQANGLIFTRVLENGARVIAGQAIGGGETLKAASS